MPYAYWTPTQIWYHYPCIDGLTAAWAASAVFPKASLHPVNYGQSLPGVERHDRILMVDFSVARRDMIALSNSVESVVVLDHHKTAEAELREFVAPDPGWFTRRDVRGLFATCRAAGRPTVLAIFDSNRSGAGLAWDWCHERVRPTIVDLVEDRDLWRFRFDESTRSLHVYLAATATTVEGIEQANKDVHICILNGMHMRRYHDARVEDVLKSAHLVTIDGRSVRAVNAPYFLASDVGARLLELYPDTPFSAVYSVSNGRMSVSLRSVDGRDDVSDVAKKYGGGGHRNAAGFGVPFTLGQI